MAEAKVQEFLGTGRRKTSVARVRLAAGSGKITVNNRPFENYFPIENLRTQAMQPLSVTETAAKFDVRVNVSGGGPSGQAGAVRHGIARALLVADANLRPTLKSNGLLTRDPRMRERKKYGQPDLQAPLAMAGGFFYLVSRQWSVARSPHFCRKNGRTADHERRTTDHEESRHSRRVRLLR